MPYNLIYVLRFFPCNYRYVILFPLYYKCRLPKLKKQALEIISQLL